MSNNALDAARIDVWMLKEIEWQAEPEKEKKKIKIVMQTLNGPCSFIALCNILILRGDIVILPEDRQEVAYEFLSSLVGDYLLSAAPDVDVAAALTILPLTQNGLDLNPLFTGAFSFRPSGEGAALKLFDHTGIQLVHGWLCDPDSSEFDAVVKTEDYDSSMDLIVEADSLTKGQIVSGWESPEAGAGASEQHPVHLPPEQQKKVEDAIAVQRYLNTTQSQLTYYGLFTLSTAIEPGRLVALFRNSHLSVLYKPLGQDSGLYTLVTDHTFAHEEAVVWEKLDDIEGSSQFVDSNFKDSTPVGGDFAGETAETVARAYDERAYAETNAGDIALARQLQAEEDAHAQAMYAQQQQQREQEQQQRISPNQRPIKPQRPVTDIHGLEDGNPPPAGSGSRLKKNKKECIIM